MERVLSILWPRPEKVDAEQQGVGPTFSREIDTRIRNLEDLATVDAAIHLEAARRIVDEEDRRKSGAESRATTFIAGVAALIPLMTWAIGNATTTTMCSLGWGCSLWTATFWLAVIYFLTAAYWALQTLAVSNYHVIGVEDILEIRENKKDLTKELIRQSLMLASRNRHVINQKLTYIQIAQRRFFNGLLVLGVLLMFDPISRLGILDHARTYTQSVFRGASKSHGQQIGLPPSSMKPAVELVQPSVSEQKP